MSGKANATGSRVTLHVVSSLDGFIARKDNSVSWLDGNGSVYEAGVSISEEEIAAFVKTIDCHLLGSRTYEHALELGWPYGDTPTVDLSPSEVPAWALAKIGNEKRPRYNSSAETALRSPS